MDYSYLSASYRKQPAPHYKLGGMLLMSAKYDVPLYWYILFAPSDISYPVFNEDIERPFWYKDQPPYMITSKEVALKRIESRKSTLFLLLDEKQKKLFDEFCEFIRTIDYPYIHLFANNVAQDYELGVLKTKMNDLVHSFEAFENDLSLVDIYFSPIANKLCFRPNVFSSAKLSLRYFYKRIQHFYWDWRGLPEYFRTSYPIHAYANSSLDVDETLVGVRESL